MTTESTTSAPAGKGRGADTSVPPQLAVGATAEPAVPPAAPPTRRRSRWLPSYTWSGTLGALLLAWSSFTPSLLPRGWLVQGIIAGITAAIGYGLGVTVTWFVESVTDRRPSAGVRRRAWQVLAVAGPLLTIVMLVLGQRWQRAIHLLVGLDPPAGYTYTGTVVADRAGLRAVRRHRPGRAPGRAGGHPAVREASCRPSWRGRSPSSSRPCWCWSC